MGTVKIYYWKEKKNFGDLLGGLLLKRFTRLESQWSTAKEADIVIVGSVLEHLPADWKGVIAGAGKLHEKSKLGFPNAKILALRGPLTARGFKGSFALADPGLLADELVPIEEKEFDLGIVPHWTDTTLEKNPVFKQFNPKIIRVSDDPLKVISEIGRCKKIVSSSLHGIILADAFGIPRRIEIPPRSLSHPNQEGGLFKWQDYSSSLGVKLVIGTTQLINRNKIIELQHELFDVFEEVAAIFNHHRINSQA